MNERGRRETNHFSCPVLSGEQGGCLIDSEMHLQTLIFVGAVAFFGGEGKTQCLAVAGHLAGKSRHDWKLWIRMLMWNSRRTPTAPLYSIKVHAKLQLLHAVSCGGEGSRAEHFHAQTCMRSHLDPFRLPRRQSAFTNAWNILFSPFFFFLFIYLFF